MEESIPFPVEQPGISPQSPASPPARRRPPILFWVLLVALVALVVIGIASIGYYFILTQQQEPSGWSSPWDVVNSEQVSTGLAVWTLAESEPEQLYRQAMAGGSLHNALATSVTTPSLPAVQRLGWLTVLGRRLALDGDPERADYLYGLAADLAIIDPELSDRQRAETLLAAAQGWADLDMISEAGEALVQVTLLAEHSAELTLPTRNQIFDNTADIYEAMGDTQTAAAVRALPGAAVVVPQIGYTNPLAKLDAPVLYPEQVGVFQAERVTQAQIFVDGWIARDGRASAQQLAALETAMVDEDLMRTGYYTQVLSDPNFPSDQRSLVLWDQVQWLTLKYRVAAGLFGDFVIPNWTAELPVITQALTDAWVGLTAQLADDILTLPTEEQNAALLHLYREALTWSRLGVYPDADDVFLMNMLNDTLGKLAGAHGVYPVAKVVDGEVVFELKVVQSATP